MFNVEMDFNCISMYYFGIYWKCYLNENYTHWAPLAHSFPWVSKTFSGPKTGAPIEDPPVQ